jgi:hypothetical protein
MVALREEAHPMEPSLTLPPAPTHPTGYVCVDTDCDEPIPYGTEAVLVQVVLLQRGDGELLKYPVQDDEDPDRDFLFEPHYFCMECWSKAHDWIKEQLEDRLPIQDPLSAFSCDYCSSGIRECVEYVGVAEVGEFRRSRRAPDNLSGPRFEVSANPMLICLSCLHLVVEGYIELWGNLTQTGECIDCCLARCWRASCSCNCHTAE